MYSAAGRISLSMLAKEKEETGSWKNMGAADSKESMDSFKEGHPVFEN